MNRYLFIDGLKSHRNYCIDCGTWAGDIAEMCKECLLTRAMQTPEFLQILARNMSNPIRRDLEILPATNQRHFWPIQPNTEVMPGVTVEALRQDVDAMRREQRDILDPL